MSSPCRDQPGREGEIANLRHMSFPFHPMRMRHKDGLIDRLGLENLCGDFEDAMKRAEELPAHAGTAK